MPIKTHTEIFSKYLFSFIIAASVVIHVTAIFLSPQLNQVLNLNPLREYFVHEPSEYAVTLEFEDSDTQIVNEQQDEEKKDSDLKKEKEPEKKREKLFVDNSDEAEDEELKVDTDKIGEKRAVAKDSLPNDKQKINDEPYAGGQTKAPLLGKGHGKIPVAGEQAQEAHQAAVNAVVSEYSTGENNLPQKHANLPQGLEKQQDSKALEKPASQIKPIQKPQPQPPQPQTQISSESKMQALRDKAVDEITEAENVKKDEIINAEDRLKTQKQEKLTIRHGAVKDEAVEPLLERDGILLANKQEETKKPEIENNLFPLNREAEPIKKERKDENATEIKATETEKIKDRQHTAMIKPETPAPSSAPKIDGLEPQRRLEMGINDEENLAEARVPKISLNINAKDEGSAKDPVLFEDTISNAAAYGMTSFNVQKHEYAAYFKHIRDRISLYWFLGYGTRAEIKLETEGDKPIIVEFKVLPDGTIDGVKVVDDAGNFNLASRLISSVKSASPLNPFPSNVKEPSIEVRFNFYFF